MTYQSKNAKGLHVVCLVLTLLLLDAPATGGSLPCDLDGESVFEDWKQWAKLTPEPVRSHGHANSWVDIYADELARETYLSAGSPYPECAKVVKAQYFGKGAETVRKLTIMVKMPAGYDPDHADWWYGIAGPGGSLKREGKLYECISCHRQVKQTDYMFSRRLKE